MYSAPLTGGRSVRKPQTASRANTFKGTNNFTAEFGVRLRYRRSVHHPAVTAMGDGRP